MDQVTLKYLRLLIPGFTIAFGFYPIYKEYIVHADLLTTADFSSITLFSILLGAIYHITNLQYIGAMIANIFITRNIKKRLFQIAQPALTNTQKIKISKNRKYMNIFYFLIDNDESLKRKGANVYFNGLFLTSTSDIFIILLIFHFIYKFLPKITPDEYKYISTFIILASLSAVLHIITTIKHIMLSNEQLDYINSHKNLRDSLKLKLNEIL